MKNLFSKAAQLLCKQTQIGFVILNKKDNSAGEVAHGKTAKNNICVYFNPRKRV